MAMDNSTLAPLVEQITQQLKTPSEAELHTMRDFVDDLAWKHHRDEAQPLDKRSAETRAMERIKDLDDPTQWITVIEAGEEVDVERLHQRLRKRGCSVDES
ncbi:hypothetical protein IQ254_29340 [Nodosilinea sp. LEGE 07088]|uniref:hypothetical protein n=1 Tax=Nodosilinea sp. LEGE 07088 TaxID=2777968 RepID=UPI0018816C98|nr:hypothetical protein [Nodosilinea sp. LEGE 07088]MBE9141257.1 hypothetical protein [Nodosilinea sp. LEGE 07088]